MRLRHLPPSLEGRLLVQLSDLHASARVRTSHLVNSLHRVAALRPAFVVYTGDYITLDSGTDAALQEVLPALALGTHGTAAVLGNHDYGRGFREEAWARKICQAFASRGIAVLRNESLLCHGLRLIGVDDLWSGRLDIKRALRDCRGDESQLALCHNPDALDLPQWDSYEGLVLSGHTHGGQCKAPFLPAPLLPVSNRRYAQGLVDCGDGRQVYINSGLGYLHQIRFGVRPEITLFTLTRDQRA